jgi:hypothetical protein
MHAQVQYREPTSNFMTSFPASGRQKAAVVGGVIAVVAIAVSLVVAPRATISGVTAAAAPKPEAARQVDRLLAPGLFEFRQSERSSSAGAAGLAANSSGDRLLTRDAIQFRAGERSGASESDPLLTPNATDFRKGERSESSPNDSTWSTRASAPRAIRRD